MAGADSVTAQLFIARDGEPLSEGFEGQVLTVEAKRIACISSTHIAMLNVVGEAGRLAGVSGKSISPIPGPGAPRQYRRHRLLREHQL